MMILVGVTVSVAIQGGVFKTASDATMETEKKVIYEQIVGSIKLKNNGEIDVKGTYEAAKEVLESKGKTVNLTSPTEITEETASATIEVVGKNGTYAYNITTQGIKETIKSDFSIEVSQNNIGTGDIVQSVRLTITPEIPESWRPTCSREEAIELVETVFKEEGIIAENATVTTLEQVNVILYNYFSDDEYSPIYDETGTDVTDLEGIIEKLDLEIDANSPTAGEEVTAHLLTVLEFGCTTIEEWAAEMMGLEYEAQTKKLIINGKEITEGVAWRENTATYSIEENGTYEIQLKLDDKIAMSSIEINNILEHVGKYVKYDSDNDGSIEDEIMYRVLYDEGELGESQGAQIISEDVIGGIEVTFGVSDPTIDESNLVDIDGDGSTFAEKALASYNNSVARLNNICAESITIREEIIAEVRSVGSNPLNPNEDTNDYLEESDLDNYIIGTDTWFEKWSDKCRKGEEGYPQDYSRAENLNVLSISGKTYWLASRNCWSSFAGRVNLRSSYKRRK